MLKKYSLLGFSKVIKKIKVIKKPKTSREAFEKNARRDVFGFLITNKF